MVDYIQPLRGRAVEQQYAVDIKPKVASINGGNSPSAEDVALVLSVFFVVPNVKRHR